MYSGHSGHEKLTPASWLESPTVTLRMHSLSTAVQGGTLHLQVNASTSRGRDGRWLLHASHVEIPLWGTHRRPGPRLACTRLL